MADFHDYLYDIVQNIINGDYNISDNPREIYAIINDNRALDTIQTMLEEEVSDDFSDERQAMFNEFVNYNTAFLNRLNNNNENNNENIIRRMDNIQINENINNTRTPNPSTPEIAEPEPIEIPQEVIDRIPQEVLNVITCPIGGEIMKNPVVNSVGQTYDRSNIQQWISRGNRTDPNTRQQITTTLIPNFSIKSLINSYIPQLGGKRNYTKKNRKYKKSRKTKSRKTKSRKTKSRKTKYNKRTKNIKKIKKIKKIKLLSNKSIKK